MTDKKVAGVCGGLGEFFGIDPTIIRVATIALMIITMFLPVIFIYVICALIIPLKTHQ
ncbi:MAG: PspC domain-containing protein [Chlamydiales bacterium]|nr:PspC domain-containing protein [Chlamydiales bacterium]